MNRGAKLIGGAVVVTMLLAGSYLLIERTVPNTSTSSITSSPSPSSTFSGPLPATTVRSAVDQWVKYFNSRDVESLMNYYGFSSELIWSGNTQGLQGGYAGDQSIRILYGSTIGKTTSLTAKISNYSEKSLSPINTNVTMILKLDGNSSVLGTLNGTILATQNWFYTSGQWQIVKENWNYKAFSVQYPASATTFPQWAAIREGKSSNLVPEKSLEWRGGPLLAGAIYAFLIGVVYIALSSGRTHRAPG